MKRRKTMKGLAALLVCLMCLVVSSCEIYSAVKAATTFYQCEVHKKDGSVVTGRIGGMRSSDFYASTKTVSVKTATSREKISADDVEYLVLWDKDYPSNKNSLMYTEYEVEGRKGKIVRKKCWMYVEGLGDHIVILGSGDYYRISAKGDLIISYTNLTGIRYYTLTKGSAPVYIASSTDSKRSMRKTWAEKLKGDPVLVNKITSEQINPWDFKTIADEYKPR